jgi:BirA family biotin operon repressor/biotin-[acetyl-CoA-carboxylase] ligase
MAMELTRVHFASIDSTNTWAKQNAHTLAPDKITLVTADTQTAGRGRFKRKWVSPAHQNVYATFCFFIGREQLAILGNIPQVLALSTVELLQELGFHPRLKWPNDVLLSGKKVAGILCETTTVAGVEGIDGRLCVVVGIGLNVNMPKELLDEIDQPATSLLVESGDGEEGNKEHDVEAVIEGLQEHFVKNLERVLLDGFEPFLEVYRKVVATSPTKILRFHDNQTLWEGIFHSVNADGSLNLELCGPEKQVKRFIAGEILF